MAAAGLIIDPTWAAAERPPSSAATHASRGTVPGRRPHPRYRMVRGDGRGRAGRGSPRLADLQIFIPLCPGCLVGAGLHTASARSVMVAPPQRRGLPRVAGRRRRAGRHRRRLRHRAAQRQTRPARTGWWSSPWVQAASGSGWTASAPADLARRSGRPGAAPWRKRGHHALIVVSTYSSATGTASIPTVLAMVAGLCSPLAESPCVA